MASGTRSSSQTLPRGYLFTAYKKRGHTYCRIIVPSFFLVLVHRLFPSAVFCLIQSVAELATFFASFLSVCLSLCSAFIVLILSCIFFDSPLEQEQSLEDESDTFSSSVLESTERSSTTRSIPFFVHEHGTGEVGRRRRPSEMQEDDMGVDDGSTDDARDSFTEDARALALELGVTGSSINPAFELQDVQALAHMKSDKSNQQEYLRSLDAASMQDSFTLEMSNLTSSTLSSEGATGKCSQRPFPHFTYVT